MVRQPPKPPTVRLSDWGASSYHGAGRRLLTSAQQAEMRRKRADVDAKLRQMRMAERERRRSHPPGDPKSASISVERDDRRLSRIVIGDIFRDFLRGLRQVAARRPAS
jgi:hypothetical protein